jgi:hypothetical protein
MSNYTEPADETCTLCGGSGEVAGDYFADDGMQPCPECRTDTYEECDWGPDNPQS